MIRLGLLLLASACTIPTTQQPELRTYGVHLPVCVIACRAAVGAVDDAAAGTRRDEGR